MNLTSHRSSLLYLRSTGGIPCIDGRPSLSPVSGCVSQVCLRRGFLQKLRVAERGGVCFGGRRSIVASPPILQERPTAQSLFNFPPLAPNSPLPPLSLGPQHRPRLRLPPPLWYRWKCREHDGRRDHRRHLGRSGAGETHVHLQYRCLRWDGEWGADNSVGMVETREKAAASVSPSPRSRRAGGGGTLL